MGRVVESQRFGRSGPAAPSPALLGALLALTVAGLASAAAAQGAGPGHGGPGGFGGQRGGGGGFQAHGAAGFSGRGLAPASPSADSGGPNSLRDFLFGSHSVERRAMPPVARFRLDDGDGFVLERSSGAALMKFEDNPEVWALTATAGPRGDTIFKNDVGDPVLRMTRLGGVTLFTDNRPEGMAVSMAGAAGSVRPSTAIGPNALFQALAQSSLRASRAAQHLLPFVVVPDATPKTDWLFADAAMVASEAFVRLCSQVDGRAIAARFARVEFLTGGSAQAAAQGQVFQITIAPSKGVAGRPSSERIYLVLRRR